MRAPFRPLASAFLRLAPNRALPATSARFFSKSPTTFSAEPELTAEQIEEYADIKLMALNHMAEIKAELSKGWADKVEIPQELQEKGLKEMKLEMAKFDESELEVELPTAVSLEDIFGPL
mmetsp:Transcript_72273/g.150972  ORF Transcript_72273/g.150972 Transcript_72273/m.150972 type:complete len:120 (+) Transcript_72273:40-399(+)